MRDIKRQIDAADASGRLLQLLDDLASEIESLEMRDEDDPVYRQRIHDLELLLRYGEHKLAQMLS